MSEIADRLAEIHKRIEAAKERSARVDAVTLVAVTKTFPLDRIREALQTGQRVFGENRVQEAVPKIEALPSAEWHLIGHLQTNKARPAARAFSLVESVDSTRLATHLDRVMEQGQALPVLLEVNMAGEASKSGFTADECLAAFPELLGLRNLHIRGLMTVAPLVRDPEDVRHVFRTLRELRDRIREKHSLPAFDQLSMGMTGDFEVAIEEGATIVRLGRAIFGDRPAPMKG